MLDLSISLLSFNNKDLLRKCLKSIYNNAKTLDVEILLVDNASADNTPQMVRKKFPDVKLIANRQNLLYVKGHNQNLERAKGRYFAILNEDTYLPLGILDKMVAFMDKNPKIGLVSCRQIDADGKVDMTCSKFPHPISEIFESVYLGSFFRKLLKIKSLEKYLRAYRYASWKRNTDKEVEVVPGSFIVGSSKLLKKIGLLDENFLFFYSEPDYCQRAKQAGFASYHLGNVTIKHLKSKSLIKLSSLRRFRLAEQGLLYFTKKYYGLLWFLILWLILRPDWLSYRLKSIFAKSSG